MTYYVKLTTDKDDFECYVSTFTAIRAIDVAITKYTHLRDPSATNIGPTISIITEIHVIEKPNIHLATD